MGNRQLRFSSGLAIQFCRVCLKRHGYPTMAQLNNGIGARQMVTVADGNALCENHFEAFEKLRMEKDD